VADQQYGYGFCREHQGAILADFAPSVISAALRLLDSDRDEVRGLYIAGPTGTGKTRLLAAIAAASEIPSANGLPTVRFGICRALIRQTWNPETQDAEIEKLATRPLLLLDDLGREGKPTENVLAVLHEVISARNGNYLPTAATSNFSLDQLAKRYDSAIADRLRPWASLVMAGKSRR
jgi:DNA replication protein DnaC